jgi:predicted kinase
MAQPKLYVLIGAPATGKTTWISQQQWANSCVIISTDNHVEAYARSVNRTYNEVFQEFMPKAIDMMFNDAVRAVQAEKDIIWDQTSMSIGSRKTKIKMTPGYYRVAVVFSVPEQAEYQRRLNSRPGKIIPDFVINSMIDRYEPPTKEEGFDEIWYN